MYFDIAKDIKIHLDKVTAPTLMQKLGVKGDRAHFSDKHTFQTDPKVEVKSGETMKVIIPVHIKDSSKMRKKSILTCPLDCTKRARVYFRLLSM